MTLKTNWRILKPDDSAVAGICRIARCSETIGAILANRNIRSRDDILCFMRPSFKNLRPPFGMRDVDKAVKRIASAILDKEKILIFGDYDVDGVTATTVLYCFLKEAGAEVDFYIPHRLKEGYGLQKENITGYAVSAKIDLIVTADCGSGSHEAVREAAGAGIDVVITDHHEILEDMPAAHAVVNPKRKDCDSGLEALAGVGVAYYLIIALRKHLRETNFWRDRPEPNLKEMCDLVALGTIADSVPLMSENRILVKAGLEEINRCGRPGVKALIRVGRIDEGCVNCEDISFGLAPRLNAAGRMEHASRAVELLMAPEEKAAEAAAEFLDAANIERRRLERDALEKILEYIRQTPVLLEKKGLVFSHGDWHQGVIGIMASRLVEKFQRPVVLIATSDGSGKGSARSVPGIDLCEVFKKCLHHLEDFGGHAMAGGLKIKVENIEKFKDEFQRTVEEFAGSADTGVKMLIDRELDLREINGSLVDELEALTPFGDLNPEPLFMASDVKSVKSWIVGGRHRRLMLKHADGRGGRSLNAIWFNNDSMEKRFDHILFKLKWNRWKGRKTEQLEIVDAY